MKKISLLLLTLLLVTGCSQDLVEPPTAPNKDDVMVRISLKEIPMNVYGTKTEVATKGLDASAVNETQISDMWVVQYDKTTKAFIKKTYTNDVNVLAYDAPLAPGLSGATNVYFLANIGPSLPTAYTETEFLTQMKQSMDENGLLIDGRSLNNAVKKNIPMYGELPNITVPTTGFMETLSVTMTRMLARVDITYEVTSDFDASILLEGIRVCNVPMGIKFIASGDAADTPTSTVPVINYEILPLQAALTSVGTHKLTFYIPENQKGLGGNTTGTNERFKDGRGVTDATYIEFVGHTKGIQGGQEVGISVYPGKDILNDYNVTRNAKYNITTTLVDASTSDQRVKLHGANCYVLKPGNTVNVSVVAANKSDLGMQIPDVTKDWKAIVYWQSAAGLVTVSEATKDKGYFTVTAPNSITEGNAVVAVTDNNDNVLWSWHIWVLTEDFNRFEYQEKLNGLTWMDRNLGAVERCAPSNTNTVGFDKCGGLYYQWGRKDPFIGTTTINTTNPGVYTTYGPTTAAFTPPATYTVNGTTIPTTAAGGNNYVRYADASVAPIAYKNQLATAIRYPLLYMNNWTGSAATTNSNGSNSWGGEFNQPKSPYDPCPEGWRVPSAKRTSTTLTTPWGSVGANRWPISTPGANGNAFYFSNGTGSDTYFSYPAVGWIGSGYTFGACGYSAYYWTATLLTSTHSSASALYFTNGSVSQANNNNRYYAQPVRCVKI